MSKKLEQAITSGDIRVRNAVTGEVKLSILGKEIHLQSGQSLDIGKRLKDAGKSPREAMRIPRLADLVKTRKLVLL